MRTTLVVLTIAIATMSFVLQPGDSFFAHAATAKYTLTVKTATGGSTSPTGAKSYTNGTKVTLTATPLTHYSFSYWSFKNAQGETVHVTDKTFKLTMNYSYTVTPVFAAKMHTITVCDESGGGKVSLSDGDHSYKEGSIVTVTATNSGGWIFDRWELDGVTVGFGSSKSLKVTMNGDHLLEVHFHEAAGKLVVGKTYDNLTFVLESWGGKITIPTSVKSYKNVDDDFTGIYTYKAGASVTITAANAVGYTFDHWELDGATVGTAKTYTVKMSAYHELDAYFR